MRYTSQAGSAAPSRRPTAEARWKGPMRVAAAVVAITGGAMLAPAVVAAIYREFRSAELLLVAALITGTTGGVAWWWLRDFKALSTVQAFSAVGMSWFAIAAFGSLPFLLTGALSSITDAFFEAASGFTATGSSVIGDPAALPHGVLFWRALTHWLGGMGVIVLAIAILPLLGVGAITLARAESPGPDPERITPRFSETAKRLWMTYAGFTAVQIVLLAAGDMNLFDSVAHSFATISGGGFSTSAESIGAFSAYSQWVVIIFMIVGGTSFALHYRAIRKPKRYLGNSEFRLFILILLVAAAVVAVGIWDTDAHQGIRDSLFTVTSVMTTTGFATADFGSWLPSLQLILLVLMFVGAMSGSTSGSIKVSRIAIARNSIRSYLKQSAHPHRIFVIRAGGRAISEDTARSVRTFLVLYLLIFVAGTALLGLIAAAVDADLGVVATASAVAASLGNIGPGLGSLGPAFTFAAVPALGKWLLAMLMIIGRLEILPVLLLASPELWRRR